MIPRGVLSDQLEERIAGRRLLAAVFLTFEFDPGFFEQDILPVLLNVSLSHARGLRLLGLEDALRDCAGKIAVFYDVNQLVRGAAGSARLDIRRIPVRHHPGVFHPKNVLLLLESRVADEDGIRAQSLLVGAMSANLTQSGWWENVEACHFEEIQEGDSTRMKSDLLDLLRMLRNETPATSSHEPIEVIRKFLLGAEQRVRRFTDSSLHAHFYSGNESFPDFLERCAGGRLDGTYLEILSPYLGDPDESAPLEELIRRFQPKEVRLMLPRDRDGAAACSKSLFNTIARLPGVTWGRLPAAVTRRGKAEDSAMRFVHAKVYRFFTQKPKKEFCFIGSVNLTVPAHAKKGNWETGMLVEVECARTPEFWLEPETGRPALFQPPDDAESAKTGGTPLLIRYHWQKSLAEAYWDDDTPSGQLRLEARGMQLYEIGPLPTREWVPFAEDMRKQFAEILKETSFVEVFGHGDQPGLLLVQEEGMSHKPSLLLQLSTADILRYWSLLSPDQRLAFIEAKTLEIAASQEGAELLARVKVTWPQDTFFDRFAGIFHSFSCLEKEVREKLNANRENDANYRLFGRKYDSLGTLLERVFSDTAAGDDVERYVILLCARQLLNEIGRDFADYWRAHREDVRTLETYLQRIPEVRSRLGTGNENTTDFAAFLDWFEVRFLKRSKPLEAQT